MADKEEIRVLVTGFAVLYPPHILIRILWLIYHIAMEESTY